MRKGSLLSFGKRGEVKPVVEKEEPAPVSVSEKKETSRSSLSFAPKPTGTSEGRATPTAANSGGASSPVSPSLNRTKFLRLFREVLPRVKANQSRVQSTYGRTESIANCVSGL